MIGKSIKGLEQKHFTSKNINFSFKSKSDGNHFNSENEIILSNSGDSGNESQIIICSTEEELDKFHSKKALDPQYKCNICSRKYSSQSVLKIHLIRHKKKEELPFRCRLCPFHAATKRDLIRHQNTRHNNCAKQLHKCELCQKMFKVSSSLTQHIRVVHTKDVIYQCGKCPFSSCRRSSIRSHLKSHNEAHLEVICPICSAAFQSKPSLKTHLLTHADVRPFACNICEKRFSFSSRLARHQQVVHGPKTFECDVCPKVFSSVHRLRRHSLIHTGERPFACCFCPFASNTQGNLVKHVRRVHDKVHFTYKDILSETGLKRDPKLDLNPEQIQELTLMGQKVTELHLQNLKAKGLTTASSLSQLQHQMQRKNETKALSVYKTPKAPSILGKRKPQSTKRVEPGATSKRKPKRKTATDSKGKSEGNFDVGAFMVSPPPIGEGSYTIIDTNDNIEDRVNGIPPASSIQVLWYMGNATSKDSPSSCCSAPRRMSQKGAFRKGANSQRKPKVASKSRLQQIFATPPCGNSSKLSEERELSFANRPSSGVNVLQKTNFTSSNKDATNPRNNSSKALNNAIVTHVENWSGAPSRCTNKELSPVGGTLTPPIEPGCKFSLHPSRCAFCQGSHEPTECDAFPNPVARQKVAKQRHLCFICLDQHLVHFCRSTITCFVCNKWHHASLCTATGHEKLSASTQTTLADGAGISSSSSGCEPSQTLSSASPSSENAFATLAPVPKSGASDSPAPLSIATVLMRNTVERKKQRAKATCDQGSQRSIIVKPLHEPGMPFCIPYFPNNSHKVDDFVDFEGMEFPNTGVESCEVTQVIPDRNKKGRNLDMCNQFLHISEDDPNFMNRCESAVPHTGAAEVKGSALFPRGNVKETTLLPREEIKLKSKIRIRCKDNKDQVRDQPFSELNFPLSTKKLKESWAKIKKFKSVSSQPTLQVQSEPSNNPSTHSCKESNIVFFGRKNRTTIENYEDIIENLHSKKWLEKERTSVHVDSSNNSVVVSETKFINLSLSKKESEVGAEEGIYLDGQEDKLTKNILSSPCLEENVSNEPLKKIIIKNSLSNYESMNEEVDVMSIAEVEERSHEIVLEVDIS